MKIKKIVFSLIILIICTVIGVFYYAFKVEPYRLVVNEHQVNNTNSKENLKIVQLSDLHIKKDFNADQLDKVIQKTNEQNPDFIIFSGDLYDNYSQYNENEAVISKLKSLKAKYGKIAIWGNRDYGGGAVREYANIMAESDFSLLRNENQVFTLDNGKKILFTGLDDALLGNPQFPSPNQMAETSYDILLTHEPDEVSQYQNKGYELILSGHSHGGQINVPLIPQIQKKATALMSHANNYTGGLYQLGANEKLYVNTGIGTTHLSARFGVAPEIAVLTF
ncbi:MULTISPECIES: metallophosphoesterase [Lactococcus]|uniref:Metallophosphoesterase n=2 Tax=Lactococcus lactis TaxID=1358 RepID=A0A2Z3KQJ8_LACLL|nr:MULTISPECIES: metallophosphoesterase [Lactococcus]AWN66179.1 metallophosphoesterase [Lactococcus lactis subsp. lactis]KST85757.1 putative a phosphohydrolase [Lactococcus lactis subsp. lactis]MBK0029271.1 metallophosphoesterase [Lactococcus sp. S47]MDG4958763.1 metallophosphoesterase [Lactococcus lactis]QNL91956.1 metallophosphoesterase [Lactococcus lactis]